MMIVDVTLQDPSVHEKDSLEATSPAPRKAIRSPVLPEAWNAEREKRIT